MNKVLKRVGQCLGLYISTAVMVVMGTTSPLWQRMIKWPRKGKVKTRF